MDWKPTTQIIENGLMFLLKKDLTFLGNNFDWPISLAQLFIILKSSSWSPSDWAFHIGLSNGIMPEHEGTIFLDFPNTYAFGRGDNDYRIDGHKSYFKWPEGAIKPTWNVKGPGDVVGCGLLLGAQKKLSIHCQWHFNGKTNSPPMVGDLLFPAVLMWNISLEANFGDDTTKRFKYDTNKFPGLVMK